MNPDEVLLNVLKARDSMTPKVEPPKDENAEFPVAAICYWCRQYIEHPFFMVGTPLGRVGARYWFCSKECKDAYTD